MRKEIKNQTSVRGFTLIELLVVISIIGILAALATFSFAGSQRQARDSGRKSDLRQYQTSTESYASKNNGLYPQRPDAAGVQASVRLCTDLGLTSCPEDSRYTIDPTYIYKYQSNGTVSDGTAAATRFVLWTKLENTTDYFVVCSTGQSGIKAQAGFSVAGGACPL